MTDMAAQATPKQVLLDQITNPNVPKNEREWAAARYIETLEAEIEALKSTHGRPTILDIVLYVASAGFACLAWVLYLGHLATEHLAQ